MAHISNDIFGYRVLKKDLNLLLYNNNKLYDDVVLDVCDEPCDIGKYKIMRCVFDRPSREAYIISCGCGTTTLINEFCDFIDKLYNDGRIINVNLGSYKRIH